MKIILLYGGRSEEHDVSVLSAYSVLNAIYYKYYQVQLVFISKDGQWVKALSYLNDHKIKKFYI